MAEPELIKLISWLKAADHPEYTLLPAAEYEKKWQRWGLPDPHLFAARP